MYNRADPRFRRRLAQLTSTVESATESTQVGLFSFSEHYLKPCFASLSAPFEPCLQRCFPSPEERKRRNRARSRGRPEYSFDFYDDWAEDENDALLSLEGDEFERVMGATEGETSTTRQPDRQRNMAYGSRDDRYSRPRKRSLGTYDPKDNPTIIPSSSRFGFLSKLPWKTVVGGKGLRYKPSAADLQERPQFKEGGKQVDGRKEYKDDESEEDDRGDRARGSRVRSATVGSGHTTDSYSSRGDIFPSDDEADADAVVLGDEFAIGMLERRNTSMTLGGDDSSGRTSDKKRRRPGGTRSSTRTMSSKSDGRGARRRSGESDISGRRGSGDQTVVLLAPEVDDDMTERAREKAPAQRKSEKESGTVSIAELKAEEARLQADEEAEIERRRESAMRLAKEKGLSIGGEVADGQMQMRSLRTPVRIC